MTQWESEFPADLSK